MANKSPPTRNRGQSTADSSVSMLQSLQSFTGFIGNAATTAGKFTQKGATIASQTLNQTIDAVGLKESVEAVDMAARKVAAKGRVNVTKAATQARRFARRTLEFDEDESFDTAEFDLLLSAAGALDKTIPLHGTYYQSFSIPANSAMVWKARVKRMDISFSVKEIRENDQVEIEPMTKYQNSNQIQGQLPACNRQRHIMLLFDNTHSLQSKIVVFWVAIGENVTLADEAIGAARSKEVCAAEEGPIE